MLRKTFLATFLCLTLLLSPMGSVDQAPFTSAAALPLQETSADLSQALPDIPGATGGWWTTVQENIRQSEYHITTQGHTYLPDLAAVYQAPNRAHNLRTYFTPQGIRITPRVFDGKSLPWELSLTLTGYGYAGDVRPVAAATLIASNNRIVYRRGELTEWYLNDKQGLEQGFTLNQPPAINHWQSTASRSSVIVLELEISGNLTADLVEDDSSVEFTILDGAHALRYSELVVTDATGRTLPAYFALTKGNGNRTGNRVRLVIKDASAHYPITIDPIITSLSPTPIWNAEGNQDSAHFGFSVGTAGDVNNDGYSDLVVGAPWYDNGETDEGRAFVYHGSASGLSATANWTAESNQGSALFGYSVGTAGDVNGDGFSDLVIGAPWYDNGQSNEGRAFVYHGSASGLSATANWTAESDQAQAWLGFSVGTAGDVNGDGYSDLVVSAAMYDNGEMDEGRAFVYYGSASGLSATANWTAESNQEYAQFGFSVGTAGDVNNDGYSDLVVGAPWYDNGETDEGWAFVYHGSASGLSATANWTAESNQGSALFGYSVGTAGDINGDGFSDLVVGAYVYDNGEMDEGRAFVYHGSASGLSATANWTAESDQAEAQLGFSVGTAGDVNGDGFSDLVVGAPMYDNGETDEGRAFVYHGSASGLSAAANWTAESDQDEARFGYAVGTAGDVNKDGNSDLVVSAAHYDNGEMNEGWAVVITEQRRVYLPMVIRP